MEGGYASIMVVAVVVVDVVKERLESVYPLRTRQSETNLCKTPEPETQHKKRRHTVADRGVWIPLDLCMSDIGSPELPG
jgi:hypothetical protein